MKEGLEQRLREIVQVSTKKAAIAEWSEAATSQFVPIYNYRGNHIDEVVELAKHLAEGTQADMEVITLAAWLHDLAKPGVGGISAERHGIASAEMAEEILTQERIEDDTIVKVSDVIRKHVGLTLKQPLEPIEAQILWEADKILKLGVIGIIQGILNSGRLFPGRSTKKIADDMREFLPLAQSISDCVVTEKGKVIAEKRLKTLQIFSEAFDEELRLAK
ncbi:MAG: HD domain-containing protein [Candidatus Thorarchaeota archaeon]